MFGHEALSQRLHPETMRADRLNIIKLHKLDDVKIVCQALPLLAKSHSRPSAQLKAVKLASCAHILSSKHTHIIRGGEPICTLPPLSVRRRGRERNSLTCYAQALKTNRQESSHTVYDYRSRIASGQGFKTSK